MILNQVEGMQSLGYILEQKPVCIKNHEAIDGRLISTFQKELLTASMQDLKTMQYVHTQ